MDLSQPVSFRGVQINTASESDGVVSGCLVESADISNLEVLRFIEPKPLEDGFYYADAWTGRRTSVLTGTVHGATRADAFDRIRVLDALFYPTAEFLSTPAGAGPPMTFGMGELDFYEVYDETPTLRRIMCRSNGLRVTWQRSWFGSGNLGAAGGPVSTIEQVLGDGEPLAIPWSVTFVGPADILTPD